MRFEKISSTISYHRNIRIGDAGINITGVMESLALADEPASLSVNTWYELAKVGLEFELSGNITDWQFSSAGSLTSYTGSGRLISEAGMSMRLSMKTGNDLEEFTDAEAALQGRVTLREGWALSAKDSDGLGGKFIFSHADRININIPLADLNYEEEIPAYLESIFEDYNINVLVYNDGNEPIGNYSYTLNDLISLDLLF